MDFADIVERAVTVTARDRPAKLIVTRAFCLACSGSYLPGCLASEMTAARRNGKRPTGAAPAFAAPAVLAKTAPRPLDWAPSLPRSPAPHPHLSL